MAHKVCPIVFREVEGTVELLAFQHPSAGKQFVKGSVEEGEALPAAALRELTEESGIGDVSECYNLGEAVIGASCWHFFAVRADGLVDRWSHETADDHGHVFAFFWHPLAEDLDEGWHPQFHRALEIMRSLVPRFIDAQDP